YTQSQDLGRRRPAFCHVGKWEERNVDGLPVFINLHCLLERHHPQPSTTSKQEQRMKKMKKLKGISRRSKMREINSREPWPITLTRI
ncbi:mCG144691, partial [Mus musculus]